MSQVRAGRDTGEDEAMIDTRDTLSHPIQPIGYDGEATEHSPQGIIRFKENKIIAHLLDKSNEDLSMLRMNVFYGNFSQEDYCQLCQLAGYEVESFIELSATPPELSQQIKNMVEDLEGTSLTKKVKHLKFSWKLLLTIILMFLSCSWVLGLFLLNQYDNIIYYSLGLLIFIIAYVEFTKD